MEVAEVEEVDKVVCGGKVIIICVAGFQHDYDADYDITGVGLINNNDNGGELVTTMVIMMIMSKQATHLV